MSKNHFPRRRDCRGEQHSPVLLCVIAKRCGRMQASAPTDVRQIVGADARIGPRAHSVRPYKYDPLCTRGSFCLFSRVHCYRGIVGAARQVGGAVDGGVGSIICEAGRIYVAIEDQHPSAG